MFRAPALGAGGQRLKSFHTDQFTPPKEKACGIQSETKKVPGCVCDSGHKRTLNERVMLLGSIPGGGASFLLTDQRLERCIGYAEVDGSNPKSENIARNAIVKKCSNRKTDAIATSLDRQESLTNNFQNGFEIDEETLYRQNTPVSLNWNKNCQELHQASGCNGGRSVKSSQPTNFQNGAIDAWPGVRVGLGRSRCSTNLRSGSLSRQNVSGSNDAENPVWMAGWTTTLPNSAGGNRSSNDSGITQSRLDLARAAKVIASAKDRSPGHLFLECARSSRRASRFDHGIDVRSKLARRTNFSWIVADRNQHCSGLFTRAIAALNKLFGSIPTIYTNLRRAFASMFAHEARPSSCRWVGFFNFRTYGVH